MKGGWRRGGKPARRFAYGKQKERYQNPAARVKKL